jgi:Kef-type K+ transport system membrane component KefB
MKKDSFLTDIVFSILFAILFFFGKNGFSYWFNFVLVLCVAYLLILCFRFFNKKTKR